MSSAGLLAPLTVEQPARKVCTIKPVEYAKAKRVFDVILASVLLVLLAPLFLIITLLVKLTSEGPVFFVSDRIGLGGKTIKFVKFRTMVVDAELKLASLMAKNEKDGPIFKIKNDPRITPIGKFLRKTSFDELPQLWSVIKGDMSMVGPRPQLPREVQRYNDRALDRLSVVPGLTCYWQVMGRSNLSYEEWLNLDLRYVEEMSFWTDVMLVLKTPFAVIAGKGAY